MARNCASRCPKGVEFSSICDALRAIVLRKRVSTPKKDADELSRLRALHPRVVLWDAHSIASVLPRFFEGRLPDLNFGTADGASCDASLIDAVLGPVRGQRDYTWVLNGRYKGGHITRQQLPGHVARILPATEHWR